MGICKSLKWVRFGKNEIKVANKRVKVAKTGMKSGKVDKSEAEIGLKCYKQVK